jgi:hypothetical protein
VKSHDDFSVVSPTGEVVFVTANIGTGASGVAFADGDKSIVIDGRHQGCDKLDTFVHESLHIVFPDEDEETITDAANFISEVLWKAGYRRNCERRK